MVKQLQAATGIVVFVFLAFHLFNTWLAALGAPAYNGVQSVIRVVYQFAPIEALLLAAIAVHMTVGVVRIVQEPKRSLSVRARMHRYSGFFLMIVIVGHVLAVRGSSWFFDVYPGFHGLAFSIDFLPWYFYPYYFLLGTTGFYHALNGVTLAARRFGWRVTLSGRRLAVLAVVSCVPMVASLLALGGVTMEIGDPLDNDFARLALDLLGGTEDRVQE